MAIAEYKVKFEVFEGPLDLLLYLIKKEEVDIYEVNLTKLATQFLEYLDLMRMLDLDIAGEFLVMAATLMYIKSRELLPRDQQVVPEDEEEEEDPRWELIRQLVEYKKFKDAAAQLQEMEARQALVYPHRPPKVKAEPESEPEEKPPLKVSLFELIEALNRVLQRWEEQHEGAEVADERWTVTEKIDFLLRLTATQSVVKFSELFASAASRTEIVVTFLALLELIRLQRLAAQQSEPFGEIEIVRVQEEQAAADEGAGEAEEAVPASARTEPAMSAHRMEEASSSNASDPNGPVAAESS